MKRNNKAVLIFLGIFMVIIIGLGIFLNKVPAFNMFTDSYLTSRSDNETSFVYHINDKKSSNGESFDFGGFNGKWSLMEIDSDKNNHITIHSNTKINKGKFCIVALDPDYKIAGKIEVHNKESEISFITSVKGKYLIRIAGKDAGGNFNLEVNSSSKAVISYKDFMQN